MQYRDSLIAAVHRGSRGDELRELLLNIVGTQKLLVNRAAYNYLDKSELEIVSFLKNEFCYRRSSINVEVSKCNCYLVWKELFYSSSRSDEIFVPAEKGENSASSGYTKRAALRYLETLGLIEQVSKAIHFNNNGHVYSRCARYKVASDVFYYVGLPGNLLVDGSFHLRSKLLNRIKRLSINEIHQLATLFCLTTSKVEDDNVYQRHLLTSIRQQDLFSLSSFSYDNYGGRLYSLATFLSKKNRATLKSRLNGESLIEIDASQFQHYLLYQYLRSAILKNREFEDVPSLKPKHKGRIISDTIGQACALGKFRELIALASSGTYTCNDGSVLDLDWVSTLERAAKVKDKIKEYVIKGFNGTHTTTSEQVLSALRRMDSQVAEIVSYYQKGWSSKGGSGKQSCIPYISQKAESEFMLGRVINHQFPKDTKIKYTPSWIEETDFSVVENLDKAGVGGFLTIHDAVLVFKKDLEKALYAIEFAAFKRGFSSSPAVKVIGECETRYLAIGYNNNGTFMASNGDTGVCVEDVGGQLSELRMRHVGVSPYKQGKEVEDFPPVRLDKPLNTYSKKDKLSMGRYWRRVVQAELQAKITDMEYSRFLNNHFYQVNQWALCMDYHSFARLVPYTSGSVSEARRMQHLYQLLKMYREALFRYTSYTCEGQDYFERLTFKCETPQYLELCNLGYTNSSADLFFREFIKTRSIKSTIKNLPFNMATKSLYGFLFGSTAEKIDSILRSQNVEELEDVELWTSLKSPCYSEADYYIRKVASWVVDQWENCSSFKAIAENPTLTKPFRTWRADMHGRGKEALDLTDSMLNESDSDIKESFERYTNSQLSRLNKITFNY